MKAINNYLKQLTVAIRFFHIRPTLAPIINFRFKISRSIKEEFGISKLTYDNSHYSIVPQPVVRETFQISAQFRFWLIKKTDPRLTLL